jgi:hypothetical protein
MLGDATTLAVALALLPPHSDPARNPRDLQPSRTQWSQPSQEDFQQ